MKWNRQELLIPKQAGQVCHHQPALQHWMAGCSGLESCRKSNGKGRPASAPCLLPGRHRHLPSSASSTRRRIHEQAYLRALFQSFQLSLFSWAISWRAGRWSSGQGCQQICDSCLCPRVQSWHDPAPSGHCCGKSSSLCEEKAATSTFQGQKELWTTLLQRHSMKRETEVTREVTKSLSASSKEDFLQGAKILYWQILFSRPWLKTNY